MHSWPSVVYICSVSFLLFSFFSFRFLLSPWYNLCVWLGVNNHLSCLPKPVSKTKSRTNIFAHYNSGYQGHIQWKFDDHSLIIWWPFCDQLVTIRWPMDDHSTTVRWPFDGHSVICKAPTWTQIRMRYAHSYVKSWDMVVTVVIKKWELLLRNHASTCSRYVGCCTHYILIAIVSSPLSVKFHNYQSDNTGWPPKQCHPHKC